MTLLKTNAVRATNLMIARLADVDKPNINFDALSSRVQDDVILVFGKGSSQHLTSIGLPKLHFDKPDKINAFRDTYRQTIQGWIDYIQDFDSISKEQYKATEETYEQKYKTLLAEWNEFAPKYNDLSEDYSRVMAQLDSIQAKQGFVDDTRNPIKILFLGASPVNADRLRLDEELRDIEIGLKAAKLRDQFNIAAHWAVTVKTLRQSMLDEHPSIVHFSGHGHHSGIAVEDVSGNLTMIQNSAIGSLFELFKDEVTCVVLNSCYSEAQAKEISQHVPYVIGMTSSVNDKAAIAFSVGFYAALGAGRAIEFAFDFGIVSMKLEGVPDTEIPILLKSGS